MTDKIGFIEPDSSHGERFSEIFNLEGHPAFWPDSGARVHAVWGTDPARVKEVADYGHVPVVADSPEQVAEECDYVFVLARHAGKHLDETRPVIAAGKPLFVDKPLTGTPHDARELISLADKTGVIVTSFSTLRYATDTLRYAEAFGKASPVRFATYLGPASRTSHYGGIAFYAIHAVELMLHFHGADIESVIAMEHVRDAEKSNIVAVSTYSDGTLVTLGLLGDAAYHFRLTAVGREGVADMALELNDNYLRGMQELMPVLRGEKPPGVSGAEMLRAVQVCEAIERSLTNGKPVDPREL